MIKIPTFPVVWLGCGYIYMCVAVSCRSLLCLAPEPPRGVGEWEVMLFQLVFNFQLKYVCVLMLALDLYMDVLSFPIFCHVFLSTP